MNQLFLQYRNRTAIIMMFLILPVLSNSSFAQQICPGAKGELSWKIWQNIDDNDFSALYSLETFPNSPDKVIPVFKLQTDRNYDNEYGSRIEGFIHVEQSDSVIFNLTANAKGNFYLSTDWNPDNARMICYGEWTDYDGHDEQPSQTSDSIYLKAGVDYYFRLDMIEDRWSDHAAVYWKTINFDKQNWSIISGRFLRGIACLPEECLPRGTPCDDGNASTSDDIADGNCNCVGTPTKPDPCVGEKGLITHYEYRGIPGSQLQDLYDATKFPGTPDYSFNSSEIGIPYNGRENVGTLIQGYLVAPETGSYRFNVTGDDNVKFFLSSDYTIANKSANEVYVPGWSYRYQHDKYPEQSSGLITLQKDTYYYYELNHKQGGGGSGYQVFWKTPTDSSTWKRLTNFHLYDYGCEVACIPEGTPCDDNNPYTNNDQYNNNCECVGTPCSGPDCDDPIAYYTPYEKCAISDNMDNREDNNWKSCAASTNPNPSRPTSHWINLDLGKRHVLLNSHIWNYNVAGQTQEGFETVAVDYSEDGVNWTELGVYNWTLANGSSQYGGFIGPNFSNIYARYVLFTSLDGTNGCRGLGKVAINAVVCETQGTVCDDENPLTINDQYDSNCECKGEPLEVNYCDQPVITLGDQVLNTEAYMADNSISSISEVGAAQSVGFTAGKSITLNPGFETQGSTLFTAVIEPCTSPLVADPIIIELTREDTIGLVKYDKLYLDVIHEKGQDYAIIEYYITTPSEVYLSISASENRDKYEIVDWQHPNIGLYRKRIRMHKLQGEIYNVELKTDTGSIEKVFMK